MHFIALKSLFLIAFPNSLFPINIVSKTSLNHRMLVKEFTSKSAILVRLGRKGRAATQLPCCNELRLLYLTVSSKASASIVEMYRTGPREISGRPIR